MRTIKVGFSKSKKKFAVGSWLIQIWENTPFSHVYLRIGGGTFPEVIYQASNSMVNFMGLEAFNKYHEVVEEFEVELTAEEYKNLLTKCMALAGLRYECKQLVGLVIVRLFDIFGKQIKNPLSGSGYVCSELVGEMLNFDLGKPKENITPKDIYVFLKER